VRGKSGSILGAETCAVPAPADGSCALCLFDMSNPGIEVAIEADLVREIASLDEIVRDSTVPFGVAANAAVG
jgi:hypothetical protein